MEVHGYTEHGMVTAVIDGVSMSVPNDMGNRYRQHIAEWEAAGNTIQPYVPKSPPSKVKLFKSTFILRMTPDEASLMEALLLQEQAWIRLLYQSVEYFVVNDGLVDYLRMVLAGQFGDKRADELLTPEI